MKKYRVTFKSCKWLIVEIYLLAALCWVTWGIAAPIVLWRIVTRFASKAVIVDADEAKVDVSFE